MDRPGPIGDAGGDPDWYGYCLDDPVNGVDPAGLEGGFRFGVRGLGPLPLLGIFFDNPVDDRMNTELVHEHGFFEDGSGENIGLGLNGLMRDETIEEYKMESKEYDSKRMRRTITSIDAEGQTYNMLGISGKKNNCQDFADTLRKRYNLLERGDRQR